jgi:hypothetical protein
VATVLWESLPDRDLSQDQLLDVIDDLAGELELSRRQVTFSNGGRQFESVHRDDHVDIWLLYWTTDDDTGWHDHDTSSGAVRVARGALLESKPRIGGNHVESTIGEGGSISFGPDHIHRLTTIIDGSISIHAYSPPLWRLGQYAIDADGLMRRVSISYAEELRPVTLGPTAKSVPWPDFVRST